MKRLMVTTLMLPVLALSPAGLRAEEGPSDVLAVAPADAWAVLCVRHMGEMDQKLNSLIQQLNAPIPFQNPITMGLSMLGFISGVDNAGGIAVVIPAVPSFQGMQLQGTLLLPVKNLKDLLSLMEPVEVEPGISKVMLQNQETFVAQKGSHAVLGPSLEEVKAIKNGTTSVRSKLNAYQAKHYEKDDLLLWVNAEAITTSEAFKAVMPALQGLNFDPAMLAQMRTLALSLRIAPAGLGLGMYVDAIPGTDADKTLGSQRGTNDSLLLGLPKERYLFAYGAVSNKEAGEMGAGMLAKALNNPQLQALKLDPAKLERAKAILTAMVKPLRTLSVGISGLPEGPDGVVALTKVTGVEGDAKQIMTSFAELIALVKGGLITDERAAPVLAALEYRPGAETIGGVAVDHLSFDLAKAFGPDAEKAQQAVAVISKVLGKDGLLVRTGAVDATHLIMTFGGGAERFKTVAALVKEKQAPLADDGGVQRSRATLPSIRTAEAYLAVDQLLSVIGAVAKAADQPMPPLSLGELNAPVALATEPVETGGVQAEVFVPMELVIAVKDLAMSTMSRPAGRAPPTSGPGATPDQPTRPRGPEPAPQKAPGT